MTVKDRILEYIKHHPEGVDDDELAKALGLSARQHANMACRQLAKAGLLTRRPVNDKIRNFLLSGAAPVPSLSSRGTPVNSPKTANWFWEGNVQDSVIAYLKKQSYQILSFADTASHERGIDIIAEKDGRQLWVSVKGYPKGTERTSPTLQAGHWFKKVVFDMIEYRERDKTVSLAIALPDYPRYRNMAAKITWIKPVAKFAYYWVRENGEVSVE